MASEEEVMYLLLTNTLGESVLVETLRSAAYYIARSSNKVTPRHHVTRELYEDSKYCYFFVQGTGLDRLIERFHLDFSPEEIRNQFNFYIRRSS